MFYCFGKTEIYKVTCSNHLFTPSQVYSRFLMSLWLPPGRLSIGPYTIQGPTWARLLNTSLSFYTDKRKDERKLRENCVAGWAISQPTSSFSGPLYWNPAQLQQQADVPASRFGRCRLGVGACLQQGNLPWPSIARHQMTSPGVSAAPSFRHCHEWVTAYGQYMALIHGCD